ncbi:MAG: SDR family oxidoreductase [Limnohabitans sp.]|nr:SDR family oxidoreductase [Limnohabitans sp.]
MTPKSAPNATQRPIALVTGASAGIGREFSLFLAEKGYDLVVVARREDRLVEIKKLVAERYGVRAMVIAEDLSHAAAPRRIADIVRASNLDIEVLINNAGYAVKGTFLENDWATHADFLQVMVGSWVHLTHLFVPSMMRKGRGRILNVSSLASLAPEPGGSLYAPVKSLMTSASRAMRLELLGTGVHCTALCPGFTYTEFHDVLGVRDDMKKLPKYMWQEARPVVEAGWRGVERNTPVVVPGAFNRTAAFFCKFLPYAATLRMMPKAIAERATGVAR